ncbi:MULTISPECIES: polyprenol monophosphomannose synthase [Leeuwenhoekiella]|jgi:dolichol-phosphate mannosyltransferase|uniref:Dolichol-phosphate mannosyltransferase n=1 Tax=Leeuwenhoekiella blandensis (strain CECT 7118 / CCUG 51940 / KCTC 22103 / MED217) TaxID=398720 RepID=A3XL70_LEEBM|nr:MULTISPECIES: polyprenol monophosphomannose synthase [Leeuwenhoekiella]EAQ49698.1 dolichol-phosphate mannosyltransferase [Leeuwenhoekiella blandensis MED217]MAO43878.1 polyprenol monophosphomannose synthase [Leeuwenhoekiella sp.]|tara:strand:- start:1688 stop:2419 length:732 start_codon:yes stop_codon:yes gene_type:complete
MAGSLVIIPTYNEAENIEKLVRNIFAQQRAFEVLVVDDNSPDGTAKLVKSLQEEFIGQIHLLERPGKNGLGTAYIAGFKWALERDYAYIFEMDADFSHAPNDLIRLYNACAKGGADLAIGSRYKTGVNVVNWPMGRVLMSYIASKYVRFITGLDIADTTAGFICYRREVLEQITLDKIKFVGYAFQIEMKFKAHLLGFNIIEVPVIFVDRTKGTSKMSTGIFSEAVFGVLGMKFKSLFKSYDI